MTTHLGFLALLANDRALLGDCLERIELERPSPRASSTTTATWWSRWTRPSEATSSSGESWADQLVTTMRALGLSEAGVYRTTTTMALHHEQRHPRRPRRVGRRRRGDEAIRRDQGRRRSRPTSAATEVSSTPSSSPSTPSRGRSSPTTPATPSPPPTGPRSWPPSVPDDERQTLPGPARREDRVLNLGAGGIFQGRLIVLLALLHGDSLGDHELADELFAAADGADGALREPAVDQPAPTWAGAEVAAQPGRGLHQARACVGGCDAQRVGELEPARSRRTASRR